MGKDRQKKAGYPYPAIPHRWDGWKDYTLRTGTALWESASGVEPEVVGVEKAICISLSSPRFS